MRASTIPQPFRKLLDESTAAMRQIPGVQNAAVGLSLPYERTLNSGVTLSDGKEAGQQGGTDVIYVTPGYFGTLQMPLLAGRDFTDADGPNSQHVAVVNQAFARKFYRRDQSCGPLCRQRHNDRRRGRRCVRFLRTVRGRSAHERAGDVHSCRTSEAEALSLVHVWFQPDWIVRTAGPVEGLTAQMQRALASADPNLPFSGFYSMRDLQAKTLATQRVEVALLTTMAALALLLSAVGIFALVANIVAQKTREIGIRIALGPPFARPWFIRERPDSGLGLGIVLGLVLCAATLRVMSSVLYGVSVYDIPTIATVVAFLRLWHSLPVPCQRCALRESTRPGPCGKSETTHSRTKLLLDDRMKVRRRSHPETRPSASPHATLSKTFLTR